MTRVKRGVTAHRRHRKMVKAAKGYRGLRHKVFMHAKLAVTKAGMSAYKGRKMKKRMYRSLWIARINSACRPLGITYSRLMEALTKKDIAVNRKILADMAVNDLESFKALVEEAKK